MNPGPKDDLDRAINATLASMVGGEPRRVSAASVRQAMGENRGRALPLWLAVAAVLVVSLGVVLRGSAPAPESPVGVARLIPAPAPVEVRPTRSPEPGAAPSTTPRPAAGSRHSSAATTTEPVYEGLPRLSIASIESPEPLRPAGMTDDPLRISTLEIAPLSVSTLSNEQEHK